MAARISRIGDEQISREAIDNLEVANPEPTNGTGL